MLDKWLDSYTNWANFILRCVVGIVFFAHGAQKLYGVFGGPGLAGAAKMFEEFGLVPGEQWAWLVGTVELAGGIALLFGFLTRYAALMLSLVMGGAIIWVHLPNGFFLPNGIEYAFTLFAANLALIVGGPGRLAIDGWLARHGILKTETRKDVPVRRAA